MKHILFFTALLCLGACNEVPQEKPRPLAKFEPANGQVLLFVGQELESIGGLEGPYDDGYLDHFPTPAGFTMYTNFAPGDTSFGYVQKGLDGTWSTDDWGDSPSNLSMQLADPDFAKMALAIGLSLVNHEEQVASGEHDSLVVAYGQFIKSLTPRPVFLRIGYEFDGHGWNSYDRKAYLKAYRRIKDTYDSMNIENVAYVWQSTGWVSDEFLLEEWYPGDEYVDWCSYSFFARWDEAKMIEFARKKGKPVFIAEATPTISDHLVKFTGQTKTTILSNDQQAEEAWNRWFIPLFETIESNPDIVKAFSYINCNWRSHAMWKQNPTFQNIDARLQTSELLKQRWLEKVGASNYRSLPFQVDP